MESERERRVLHLHRERVVSETTAARERQQQRDFAVLAMETERARRHALLTESQSASREAELSERLARQSLAVEAAEQERTRRQKGVERHDREEEQERVVRRGMAVRAMDMEQQQQIARNLGLNERELLSEFGLGTGLGLMATDGSGDDYDGRRASSDQYPHEEVQ